jgi:hypothetical protein
MSITRELPITEENKGEATRLLEATIANWEALHKFCLDNHIGYDLLFQIALIIEDGGFLKLPIKEVQDVLRG